MQLPTQDNPRVYETAFRQIQGCGDIISSILLVYKSITELGISTQFDPERLRSVALRASDQETCTFLWHVNALIVASRDLAHLLLAIDMMFDRFLGNKQAFFKEKQKLKSRTINKSVRSAEQNGFIGTDVVEFIDSYEPSGATIVEDKENVHMPSAAMGSHILPKTPLFKVKPSGVSLTVSDENDQDATRSPANDENRDFANTYDGQISSPISFRLRHQKRLVQTQRRQQSMQLKVLDATRDDGFSPAKQKRLEVHVVSETAQRDADRLVKPRRAIDTSILSPFNINKFAKRVDRMSVAE